MTELPWIKLARSYVGLKEIKGVRHNPTIIEWLEEMGSFQKEARSWWKEDETAWCGLFLGWIIGKSGRYVTKEWYRAREWVDVKQTKLDKPAYGCIAVMQNHVGFVVGEDANGNIMLLGGNQGDMVKISPFKLSGFIGFYWPSRWIDGAAMVSVPYEHRYKLPKLQSGGKQVSTR